MSVKGYKIFNPDWTCRGKQYTCPGEFEENVIPSVCNRGMHICEKMADCFGYYSSADNTYHYAEVEAYGEVVTDDDKSCTNKLRIVRELAFDEVKKLTNTGNCNTGDWNTGDWNTGDCNTGDWNKSDGNSGVFMTEEQTIPMFNKPSDWTIKDWWNCEAREILDDAPQEIDAIKWIRSNDMTDSEKTEHPEYKTTGGYLKVTRQHVDRQAWWDKLPEKKKQTVMALPNFDADVFYECAGIRV